MSKFCKLMDLTGPLGFPTSVAVGIVTTPPHGDSFREEFTRATLTPNDQLQRTLFEFDDEQLITFENQLELGINALGGGQDLGIAVINETDVGEKTVQFHPGALSGPFYELTYKVI